MSGYHLAHIPRGQLGEASKVLEETLEFIDAVDQGSKVMALVELADLVGAVRLYLANHHPSVDLNDLIAFSEITARAFASGVRTART